MPAILSEADRVHPYEVVFDDQLTAKSRDVYVDYFPAVKVIEYEALQRARSITAELLAEAPVTDYISRLKHRRRMINATHDAYWSGLEVGYLLNKYLETESEDIAGEADKLQQARVVKIQQILTHSGFTIGSANKVHITGRVYDAR